MRRIHVLQFRGIEQPKKTPCSPSPLDTTTEARLASATAQLGEAPNALAARAVGSYIDDLEDYAGAAAAWAELDPAAVRPLDDMKPALNLTADVPRAERALKILSGENLR